MIARERPEAARFWIDRSLGDLEVLHARYLSQSFAPHSHEGFAIAAIERGIGTFRYRGANHVAPAGSIVVIHPGELHTGQASANEGWSYRILYPAVPLVTRATSELAVRSNDVPFFPVPVIRDAELVRLFVGSHRAFEVPGSALERESRLLETLALLVARHAAEPAVAPPVRREHDIARRAREFIDAHHQRNVTLAELASMTGMGPYRLLRAFRATTGLPPHAYLAQTRVGRAKRLLREGRPISRAALESGFVDQSHLTKHFRRIVGITPGEYRRAAGLHDEDRR